MKVNSIQEMEDHTIVFNGELNPTEAALVISMGLNGMLSLGMMHLIPDMDATHSQVFNADPDNMQ